MTDTDTDSVLQLLSTLGEASDSAEADDPSAALPRLLRYALWVDERREHLPQRLLAEIVALAPDQQAAALAWAEEPYKTAHNFAGKLDAAAAHTDRPILRQLADCIRVIATLDTSDSRADQRRVVLALSHALNERDLRATDGKPRADLHKVLIGWALVAAGAIGRSSGLAGETASFLAEFWLRPILARTLAEERDRVATEARKAEESAKHEAEKNAQVAAENADADTDSDEDGDTLHCRRSQYPRRALARRIDPATANPRRRGPRRTRQGGEEAVTW